MNVNRLPGTNLNDYIRLIIIALIKGGFLCVVPRWNFKRCALTIPCTKKRHPFDLHIDTWSCKCFLCCLNRCNLHKRKTEVNDELTSGGRKELKLI